MITKIRGRTGVPAAWLGVAILAAGFGLGPAPEAHARSQDGAPAVDHSDLDALLKKYVTPDGVRYRAWSESEEDRRILEGYLTRLAEARPGQLARDERLAFWINVYNALTLDLVLDHYPLDSIRDIGGPFTSPWKKKLITVEGRELSLNEIENDILREEWDEPRIHFALNCASVSCPPLRPEAYDSRRLDEQLQEQTAAFLGNSRENFVDGKGRLHLSKIFEWYREDFEAKGSVVDFVRPYVAGLRADGPSGKIRVKHGDYDWRLNEAKP